MRKFNINVDGTNYVVEVEEIGGAVSSAPIISTAVASAPVAKAAVAVGAGEKVVSPMPGVVLSYAVASGASVKKNDTVLFLEAMKMENPIVATKDGVVNIVAAKGATVDSGDVLFTIA